MSASSCRELDHAGAHGDDVRVGVHAVAGKRGEFAPAQGAEHGEQDEQPVAAVGERVGQGEDLGDGQDWPLWGVFLASTVDAVGTAAISGLEHQPETTEVLSLRGAFRLVLAIAAAGDNDRAQAYAYLDEA